MCIEYDHDHVKLAYEAELGKREGAEMLAVKFCVGCFHSFVSTLLNTPGTFKHCFFNVYL